MENEASAGAKSLAANYPLTAWGGNALLNQVFGMYYAQNPSFFNLSQVVSELNVEFTGTTAQAPTVELGPLSTQEVVDKFNQANGLAPGDPDYAEATLGADPPNFALTIQTLTVSIYDYVNGQRGELLAQDDFTVISYGIFAIQNSRLVLTALTAQVEGGTGGDKPLVQTIVNNFVLPAIVEKVGSITLPQFQDIFGTGLKANISGVTVADQLFNLYASISPSMFSSVQAQISATEDEEPILNAFVSNEAVNALANVLLKPISTNFDETTGGSFGGAGIRGSIYMQKPSLRINGSSASASARLSISAEGGVKVFWSWVWVPLPVPDTNVVIDIRLASNSTDAYIQLTGVENIHVDLGNWPAILDPVKSVIESLLDAIVNAFRGQISSAISGIKLDLFSLPNEIPGMDIPANLNFTNLGFANSGVQAAIRVSAR